jgi:hypothetical protein
LIASRKVFGKKEIAIPLLRSSMDLVVAITLDEVPQEWLRAINLPCCPLDSRRATERSDANTSRTLVGRGGFVSVGCLHHE